MMSFSEGLVPVAMSQMSCLTQLAGSAAAMVVKMASVSSSADLLLRLWLRTRRAPAFKRSPAPVAVMISAPKMALAEPTERTATTAEKTVAGFIL